MTRRTAAMLLTSALTAAAPLGAADDALMRALRDELGRSTEKLRLEGLEKPYFIAYRVQHRRATRLSASFGSLVARTEGRTRFLTVELRVGDPSFDNTNFFGFPSGPSGVTRRFGPSSLSLDDDYTELRRQLWLATDGAYKKAVEDISKKRAALQNRTRTMEVPDFASEAQAAFEDERPPARLDLAGADALVRELSALFRQMPAISTSTVQLETAEVETRYLNSEGTSFTRRAPSASLTAVAATQAADGMPLEDFVAVYGRSTDDLPKKADLALRIQELGARLAKLRQAPIVDRYNGPVLFEGQAAAELLSQVLVPRLLGTPRPVFENAQMERFAEENPFLDKLGARVLPEFLSVADNPLLEEQGGVKVVGGYPVDDEGVPAKETKLVEKGILQALLATRSPVRGITRSNGHRRGAGPAPANLIVTAEPGREADALRQDLLERARKRGAESGIVVRRLGNPILRVSRDTPSFFFGPPGREGVRLESVVEAYRLFPDGREELVRLPEVSGLSVATLKEIVAASKTLTVYNAPFSPRTASLSFGAPGEGGPMLVSFVTPSLLFEEVTLQKPSREAPKPPVLEHPFFSKQR